MIAEVLPAEKAAVVKQLQEAGCIVAMRVRLSRATLRTIKQNLVRRLSRRPAPRARTVSGGGERT